ncbi:MAG: hypothetical protein N2746_06960 [Deltaproteobacteria bacterium]|nr:hypothetical protein [Deltaproteobacteria bacterium]
MSFIDKITGILDEREDYIWFDTSNFWADCGDLLFLFERRRKKEELLVEKMGGVVGECIR